MESTDKTVSNSGLTPWKPGQSGNPAGRPKSVRNLFSEKFLRAFLDDFSDHGAQAIETVRNTDPSTYLRVAASIVPKEFTLNEGETSLERLLEQFTDGELAETITGLQLVGIAAKKRASEADAANRPDSIQ